MIRRICTLFLALAMILGLAACSQQTPENSTPAGSESQTPAPSQSGQTEPGQTDPQTEPAPVEKVLRLTGAWDTTFNPFLANSTTTSCSSYIHGRLYNRYVSDEGVVYLRPELAETEPEMADAEGLVWNIKMKDSACFHDGTPITAETMEETLRLLLDPKLAQVQADYFFTYINVTNAKAYFTQITTGTPVDWNEVGIKVIAGNTLQLTLSTPATAYLIMKTFEYTGTCPVDVELFRSCMSADGLQSTYGTELDLVKFAGPFVIEEWVKSSTLVLKKNTSFVYADEIKITEIDMIDVSGNSALEMYEKGELDSVSLDADHVDAYIESPDCVYYPNRYLYQIEINDGNPEKPILANKNFKDALWYAVDRATLAKLMSGSPTPYIIPDTSSLVFGNTQVLYKDTETAKSYRPTVAESYDPVKAKEYFDQAMKEEGLSTLELKLLATSNARDGAIAAFLKERLEKIFGSSFTLTIDSKPSDVRLSEIKGFRTNPASYELALSQWSRTPTDESPYNVFDVYTMAYSNCNAPYHCETIDTLIALQETDPTIKTDPYWNMELAARMEKAFIEERVSIPLYERGTFELVKERVLYRNPNPSQTTGVTFQFWSADVID